MPRPFALPLRRHVADTVALSAPLAVAQLSQMAMGLTDTVMLGGLGQGALAAGGLAAAVFFTVNLVLQGVMASVGVLAAQARGAGQAARLPALFSAGFLLALLLAVPAMLALGAGERFLLSIGEPPDIARDAGRCLRVLRWGVPGALVGVGLMRALLPALGVPRPLLWVAPAMAVLNGVLDWVLIRGAWGLPRLGLLGPAAATAITLWVLAALLLLVLRRPALRPLARPTPFRPALLAELLRIGLPVGATQAVEAALFLATGLMAGLLGPAALAAHQVALSVTSFCFVVPAALGQAANVRVGVHAGAKDLPDARRAGLAAIALAAAFMAGTGLLLLAAPGPIVALYLDPALPANAAPARLAGTLLAVAALFQVADGVQAAAAGALRGLKDTRTPMLLAAFGYWGLGFPLARLLGFRLGFGVTGVWLGLAAGLAAVAALLTWRFHRRSRTPSRHGARRPHPEPVT